MYKESLCASCMRKEQYDLKFWGFSSQQHFPGHIDNLENQSLCEKICYHTDVFY